MVRMDAAYAEAWSPFLVRTQPDGPCPTAALPIKSGRGPPQTPSNELLGSRLVGGVTRPIYMRPSQSCQAQAQLPDGQMQQDGRARQHDQCGNIQFDLGAANWRAASD